MTTKFNGIFKSILDEKTFITKDNSEGLIVTALFEQKGSSNQYENKLSVQAFGAIATDFKDLKPGSEVDLDLSIFAKEYNGKYFTNVSCKNMNIIFRQDSAPVYTPPASAPTPTAEPIVDDGLPF